MGSPGGGPIYSNVAEQVNGRLSVRLDPRAQAHSERPAQLANTHSIADDTAGRSRFGYWDVF